MHYLFITFILCVFINFGLADNITSSSSTNLTEITWAHAVNDRAKLAKALQGDVIMIEADIVMGTLIDDPRHELCPIMAHPPVNQSDLSFEDFLHTVFEYNKGHLDHKKGIKLDFKSIDAFEHSINIISRIYNQITYPIWFNADILSGPINSTTTPVDSKRFINGAKQFKNSVLSIGWTTLYGPNINKGSYTKEQIDQMLAVIKETGTELNITFPVRAGLAAQSSDSMHRLVNDIKKSTLTIWSSEGDPVNVEQLRKLIFSVGLDRTYVDVPESLRKQLHLDQPPK